SKRLLSFLDLSEHRLMVELVALEDFDSDRTSVAIARQFLNVIKHLGNELQIPIVAAGTQDAFNALQTDPQLANRFEPAVLRRWTMGEDYLRLLASFEVALPLEQRSGLVEPALALKILSLSEGTIGEISALLCRAALEAIERGTEQITGASLERCGTSHPPKGGVLPLAHIDVHFEGIRKFFYAGTPLRACQEITFTITRKQ